MIYGKTYSSHTGSHSYTCSHLHSCSTADTSRDSERCSKFRRCDDHTIYERTSAKDLVWHDAKHRCRYCRSFNNTERRFYHIQPYKKWLFES
ncbi:MAG: hypothetical protein KGI27_05820 [Thaumarchaeota archaeon]|nr:hypothetical protein [Nitrososphaerota archaeon]